MRWTGHKIKDDLPLSYDPSKRLYQYIHKQYEKDKCNNYKKHIVILHAYQILEQIPSFFLFGWRFALLILSFAFLSDHVSTNPSC